MRDPARYYAWTTWTLLALVWPALLLADAPPQAIRAFAMLTAIAVFVGILHRRRK